MGAITKALEGVYGAFVNTDGFTIGEVKEVYAGMRIFELAKQVGTVRHFVWSALDYSYKVWWYSCMHMANIDLSVHRKEDSAPSIAVSTTMVRPASATG